LGAQNAPKGLLGSSRKAGIATATVTITILTQVFIFRSPFNIKDFVYFVKVLAYLSVGYFAIFYPLSFWVGVQEKPGF
jgi:hypothetical protein